MVLPRFLPRLFPTGENKRGNFNEGFSVLPRYHAYHAYFLLLSFLPPPLRMKKDSDDGVVIESVLPFKKVSYLKM